MGSVLLDDEGEVRPGRYNARAISAGLGETTTGTEQLGIEFRFSDDPNVTLWWYGYFTDKAFEGTAKAVRALGWGGQDIAEVEGDEEHVQEVFPNEVQIVVIQEEAQKRDEESGEYKGTGRMRSRIRFINPIGAARGVARPMSEETKRQFSEAMRDRFAAVDGPVGARLDYDGKPLKF